MTSIWRNKYHPYSSILLSLMLSFFFIFHNVSRLDYVVFIHILFSIQQVVSSICVIHYWNIVVYIYLLSGIVVGDSSKQLTKVEYSTRPYLSMLILLCVYVRHYCTSVLLVVILLPPCCHTLLVTVANLFYCRKKIVKNGTWS